MEGTNPLMATDRGGREGRFEGGRKGKHQCGRVVGWTAGRAESGRVQFTYLTQLLGYTSLQSSKSVSVVKLI